MATSTSCDERLPPTAPDRSRPASLRINGPPPGALEHVQISNLEISDVPVPAGFDSWTAFEARRPADFKWLNEDIAAASEAAKPKGAMASVATNL